MWQGVWAPSQEVLHDARMRPGNGRHHHVTRRVTMLTLPPLRAVRVSRPREGWTRSYDEIGRSRPKSCRARTTGEQWKTAMIEKGWV